MIGKLFVVAIVALIGCTSAAPWLDGKIVGGCPVNITEIPWQVSVIDTDSEHHWCGGSIISNRWILTSARSVFVENPRSFKIRVGSDDRLGGGEIYEVDKTVRHHNYGGQIHPDYDYGLIRLKEELTFNERVQPIKMPKADDADIDTGTICSLSGWGYTNDDSGYARYLRAVQVPKVDQDLCNSAHGGKVTERMFCGGYYLEGGKDDCLGDNGGPVVVFDKETKRPTVVGIVSWSKGCAEPGYPRVFAKILTARQWIQNHTDI